MLWFMALDLVLIVAHPDDECYGTGGTLAEYAAKGLKTGLITLTKGSSGRHLDLCTIETLAEFRALELLESVRALEISDFVHLDHPDAAPENRAASHATSTPSTFTGGLQSVPRDLVVGQVMEHLERMQPKVVITFPPDGGNRHPDHIASHEIAMEALERGGHLARGCKVYAFANATLLNPDWADTWQPPTHYRDVRDYLIPKMKAIAAHKTQALSTVNFLGRLPERIITESFRRLVPAWDGATIQTTTQPVTQSEL
jgi:N-acetylglucosamine malate deacetylase 2